jgi:SAM-dependent methyltransferase
MTDEGWSGARVARWLRQAAGLEAQFRAVSDRLFANARLQPGEAVLDVGCGTGPTTRVAAAAVGPTGRVTGLDISDEMLEMAAASPVLVDEAPIEWVVGDAVTWNPPEAAFDIVISRFGVMFFSDPPAAFATLARATRRGGRLAMVVWARRDESELFDVPFQVAVATLRQQGADPVVPPDDSGPFSLQDPDAVSAVLGGAGWRDVNVESVDLVLPMVGGVPAAEAAVAAVDFGPTRMVMTGASAEDEAAVREALAETFGGYLDAAGHVMLQARIRLVTAQRG